MAENRELALVLKLVADQFQSELKKSGGMLGEFNKFITDWKTQLLAAGGALFAVAKSTANYGEELLKTSQKVGINVQALAGLQHAANLADLSSQQLAQGIKFLAVNMVEASRQTGDGDALFRRIGVSATDLTGKLRPTEEVLLDVAEAFAKSKDGAGKSEVAVKLFGKAGLDLIPFLNQGKTGIKDLMIEAERLGLVMSKQDAEAANRFNDELKKLTAQLKGITFAIGKEVIPVMTDLLTLFRDLGVGAGVSAGLNFLHERFVGLNVLLKELQANAQFLFGTGKDTMNLEQLRARIAEIEAEAKTKLFESRNPGVLTPSGPGAGAGSSETGKDELAQLADQEKLAKAKVDIFKSQNEAIEIHNRLMREAAAGENEFFAAFDRREQFRKEDEADQEQLGRMIVERTALEVKLRDEALTKERDGLIANQHAWIAYYDQLGGDAQNFLAHKTALLEAQLSKELDLTKEQSKELLNAWQERDSARAEEIMKLSRMTDLQKETIELNTTRQAILNANAASDDFITGWADGMRNYVRDTKSGFGLAADLARRTAQLMESSFRKFFFEVMDGKIQSLKDVFRSLLDFTKQIVAQISAQLVTSQILRFASGFGGGAGGIGTPSSGSSDIGTALAASGGTVIRRFAMGGPVPGFGNQDSVPALLTPGEVVLSRRDVGDIKGGLGGGVSVVVNNYAKADVQASSGPGVDGKQMLYITVRDMVRGMARGGDLDGPMSGRYGLTPKPIGR